MKRALIKIDFYIFAAWMNFPKYSATKVKTLICWVKAIAFRIKIVQCELGFQFKVKFVLNFSTKLPFTICTSVAYLVWN